MRIVLSILAAIAASSLAAHAAQFHVGFGAGETLDAEAALGEARAIQVGFPAPARDANFQRRLDMIDALERTKDDAHLSELIRADEGLYEYEIVLRRAVVYLKDPTLVHKLLDAPALDRTSDAYKRAVGDVYGYSAANDQEVASSITGMLLERFKDDQKAVQSQLDFTLSTLSGLYPFTPNVELARALVQAGGDFDATLAKVRAQIALRQDPNASAKQYLLARLEAWVLRYRG